MEFLPDIGGFWDKYYPLILTALASISAIAVTVALIWAKVKPIIDMIKGWLAKDKEDKKNDISSELKMITMDTQITDLKAKIENPTVSDELKQQYISQLATLETLRAKLEAGLVVVEDKTSKYS